MWIKEKKTIFSDFNNDELSVVGMQETDDAVLSDRASKQVIVLDTVSRSLYLIMGKASETMEWQRIIRAAAVNNSRSLADQQLTKDDVPVIVDKCINFVYAHGM